MSAFYCSDCPFFSSRILTVVSHVGVAHAHEPGFSVQCGIEQCQQRFTQYASYRQHLRRKHRQFVWGDSNTADSFNESVTSMSSDMDIDQPAPACSSANEHLQQQQAPHECGLGGLLGGHDWRPGGLPQEDRETNSEPGRRNQRVHDFLAAMSKSIVQFYMQVTESCRLPSSTAAAVFNDMRAFMELFLQGYNDLLRDELSDRSIPVSGATDLLPFDIGDLMDLLWSNLSSEHVRMKYIKENFPYVEPKKVKLSEDSSANSVAHVAYYVPIRDVLTNMLKSDEVAEQVLRRHQDMPRADGRYILVDVTDGDFVNRRSLVSDGTLKTLLLLLYTDELELANPLGAAAGQHKILCIYFVLLNLHPRYRSRLSSIHLALLVKFSYVKQYGVARVFKPLLDDLTALERDGVSFVCQNTEVEMTATVCAVVGDNLSLNRLGGFSCSFHSGRVCRHCLAQSHNLSNLLSEGDCLLRTAEVHESHIAAVKLDKANARLYGVNEESCLLALPSFDITTQLPPDAMHDILEGSIATVVKSVMQGLSASGYITTSNLVRVSTFKYQHHDKKAKPPPMNPSFLSERGTLKGTAAQKLTLFRLLPQLFGDLIPNEDEDWGVYLAFREIADIILADKIPESCVTYLETQIAEFLKMFVTKYPQTTVIPKLHYLVHYPRYIRLFGPPRNFWCMRFEAKHAYFKALAVRVRRFSNLCKTLAQRHQLLQSYEFSSSRLDASVKSSALKKVSLSEITRGAVSVLRLEPVGEEVVYQSNEVTMDSQTYRTHDILLTGWNQGTPTFVQVKGIYLWRSTFHIACQRLSTRSFNGHRQCYEVSGLHGDLDFVRLTPGEEICHQAISIYEFGDSHEVVPPYKLFEISD